jgi:ubiquinone/menaquinone biosynthesis C-methylase UbiE
MADKEPTEPRARDFGLPDYFDMQAVLGHTKHVGGWFSTQEMAELCHLRAGQELLYVGLGSGTAATKIALEYECRVVGVDLLESMVRAAEEWAARRGVQDRVEFQVADAQDLPFEDNRFDVLFCESVNTFVPDPDRAASEYVRVVKPGGYVGLNEAVWVADPPEAGEELIDALTGERLRYPEEWVAMLETAGLQEIVARTYAVDMRQEMRSQGGFISARDYLRIFARFFGSLFSDAHTRNLMRTALSGPRSAIDYMGYGLYVGQKPAQ